MNPHQIWMVITTNILACWDKGGRHAKCCAGECMNNSQQLWRQNATASETEDVVSFLTQVLKWLLLL